MVGRIRPAFGSNALHRDAEQNGRHERLHLTLKMPATGGAPEFAGGIEGIPDAVR